MNLRINAYFLPARLREALAFESGFFLAEQFQEITRNLPKERIPLRFIHKQKKNNSSFYCLMRWDILLEHPELEFGHLNICSIKSNKCNVPKTTFCFVIIIIQHLADVKWTTYQFYLAKCWIFLSYSYFWIFHWQVLVTLAPALDILITTPIEFLQE